MEKQVEQVKEFYKKFRIPFPDSLKFITVERAAMRNNILSEEVNELLNATLNNNLVEVADAITDCMYILIGTAIEYGISDKLPIFFDEVHRSNMSKLDDNGEPILREDGKILKSNNYTPPNLKNIVWDIQK
jgi:predicted HAD superfamily Cof-like phosphohydrolase